MIPKRVITVLLTLIVVIARANNIQLSELIQRIHRESDSATVCFIGIEGDFLEEFMKSHSNIPVLYFSSLHTDYTGFSFNNVIIVFDGSEKKIHQNFEVLQTFISHLSVRKFVIIFTSNLENLTEYFFFFEKNRFTRIFGINDTIPYAFFPYANEKVHALNKDGGRLPDASRDLTNFIFRTTIQKDFPRAFRYNDSKGQPQIGGRIALTFVNFLRKHNATFEEILINNSTALNILGVINATIYDRIDISMNVYGEAEGLDMSYPLKLESWIIMVPINGHLDPYEYFKRPFSPGVWICIGMTLIYITAIEIFLDRCINSKPNIWANISQTYLMILRLPTEGKITSAYRIRIQVFLFAFIIGNLYNIYFTSFLTVFINVKQFDTEQDFVDNKVPVMIPDFEFSDIYDFHGFEKILIPTNYSVYLTEMNSMRNTSFGYTIGGDKCDFLIRLRSFYEEPLFRKARVAISQFYLGFLLPFNSPFKEILDAFIFHIDQTGLPQKWEADAAYQSIQAGYLKENNKVGTAGNPVPHNALTLNHLLFGFSCLIVGLILGIIVFICELFL